MATKIDISKKRGDTRRIVFQIKDEDGQAVDISGWSNFLLTISSEQKPLDTANQLDQLIGFIIDGASGRVGFIPSGSVAVGNFFYDGQGTDDNSEIYTLAEGKFSITQDITK